MLKRLFIASATYTGLGLLGGLYYRELTRGSDFTGFSQLGLVHTHLLVLGTLFGLVAMTTERLFRLSASRFAKAFEITWHLGIVVTAGMMVTKGTLVVLGHDASSKALAGIAGSGHILLTAAFVLFFISLWQGVKQAEPSVPTTAVESA